MLRHNNQGNQLPYREIQQDFVEDTTVLLKSVSFYNWNSCFILHIFWGCLEHENDICIDCLIENRCGDGMKNDQCNNIKIAEMDKLIQDETKKIKGNADLHFSYFISEIFFAVQSDSLKS